MDNCLCNDSQGFPGDICPCQGVLQGLLDHVADPAGCGRNQHSQRQWADLVESYFIADQFVADLRSVSVSGWNDFAKAAELLGKNYVYSRKPTPAYMSGANPQWDELEKDMRDTYAVAADCNVEILFRDVYDINGDRSRLRKWVDMTKAIFQM